MQIPIITNESLSQMTLMQLTSYVLKLLSEALPHIANVETDEASSAASASAASASAIEAAASASAAATSLSQVETAVNAGIERINSAVTAVLNTEV